jgi:hypothetical protein
MTVFKIGVLVVVESDVGCSPPDSFVLILFLVMLYGTDMTVVVIVRLPWMAGVDQRESWEGPPHETHNAGIPFALLTVVVTISRPRLIITPIITVEMGICRL